MDTAKTNIVQPGQDSAVQTKKLHQNLSTSLNQLGENSTPTQLNPPQNQPPLTGEAAQETEKPFFELDLEDIMEGEKGHPRTEPSKSFLAKFFEKLKKKNPKGEIVRE